jgi:tetratricopeptide (TPR) repeat protein
VNQLDHSNSITPFWRRLQESFHYPLHFDSLLLIIGISFLTAIASFLPFSLILNLLLTSALFKYSFSCLERTSKGYLLPPDMNDAYGGGFGLIFQLIFMVLVIFAVIGATYVYISPMLGSVVGVLLIISIPAIIINFAITENMLHALNPLSMLRLITSIGLPYGLILAFIMIMIASVSIISEFIGHDFSLVSLTLQSAVSNYYMIVIFHIMGYMIYQFHSELDFDSTDNYRELKAKRSVFDITLANIDVALKEGKYDVVIELYIEVIASYPQQESLKHQFFELLIATKNTEMLDDFANKYFNFLMQSNRNDQVSLAYKKTLKVYPKFNPDDPDMRLKIAKICAHNGDAKYVIRLLNGIQKSYPYYSKLKEAFELMAEAFEALPNMQKQSAACRQFIKNKY